MEPGKAAQQETLHDIAVNALEECEEYFDQRADAEYSPDSAAPRGNEEMGLLVTVRAALYALRGPS